MSDGSPERPVPLTETTSAWQSVRSILLAGLLVGGLYGTVICALHVTYNHLGAGDAAMLLGWMTLLYGAWGAGAFFAGLVLSQAGGWLKARISKRASAEYPVQPAGALAGLFLFQLSFWQPALLYGLTYEQTVLFHPRAYFGMVAYLVAASLVITATVLAVSFPLRSALARVFGWEPSSEPRGGRALRELRVLAVAAGGALVALPVLGLLVGEPREAAPEDSAPEIAVAASNDELRVVMIGLDGADPGVLESLRERGLLPTFDRILREGAAGDLDTLPDANSAVIWASIYTGATPSQHGVHDFYRVHLPGVRRGIYPVHRTYFKEIIDRLERLGITNRSIVTRSDLERPPIWEITDHARVSSGVVDGYLYSFPAFAAKTDGSFFLAYGADGFSRLLARRELGLSELHLFVKPKEIFPTVRELLDQPDFAWQSSSLLAVIDDVLTKAPSSPQDATGDPIGVAASPRSPAEPLLPRLLNLYTHEPDSVQHQTWSDFEPAYYSPRSTTPARARQIPDAYVAFDQFLASLLERLDDADRRDGRQTVLVIASDHGHVPTILHALETQHRHGPPGILLMHGGPVRAGYTLDSSHVYDLFPTLLHLLGLPIPEDAPGRVLEEAFEHDFRSHEVRTVPSWSFLDRGTDRGAGAERNRLMNREEIEKLRRLGYL